MKKGKRPEDSMSPGGPARADSGELEALRSDLIRAICRVQQLLDPQSPRSVAAGSGDRSQLLNQAPGQQSVDARLQEAQDMIYRAWESDMAERLTLAREALVISEDCADAYTILAMEAARNPAEELHLLRQAVAAGERALGKDMFEAEAGSFWLNTHTRPYMRARAQLAHCLWRLGERWPAIEHYYALLHLNPGDNQGIRYPLATALFSLNLDALAGNLLQEYRWDRYAAWLYNWALWSFRTKGVGRASAGRLTKALASNPGVPGFLLGRTRLPQDLPGSYSPGSVEEAALYAADMSDNWRRTTGTLAWLSAQGTAQGPTAF